MTALVADRAEQLPTVAREIGVEVAAAHALDVDREARFPHEAIEALRAVGALGAGVPQAFGGPGANIEAVALACFELGRSCAATAMIFAMHQTQVLTLVRHAERDTWIADHLQRIATEQRLVASATSEVGTGGDLGRSVAALLEGPEGRSFEKHAPTVSYGAQADDLLVTLRRSDEAEPGDQVAVLVRGDQIDLEPTGVWDPFGMRGTCSPGFVIRATCHDQQVLPAPFAQIAAESMTPLSHVLWSHVWLGIATDAFDRAREAVRVNARRQPESGDRGRCGCRSSPASCPLCAPKWPVGSRLSQRCPRTTVVRCAPSPPR